MTDERNGFLGSLLTFLTGAAIGAGVALLFAPQSGKETRKKIKDGYDQLSEDVKDQYEKFSKEAKNAIDSVKCTSERAVSQIKGFLDGRKSGDDGMESGDEIKGLKKKA